ncbi:Unknown protein, partial [Striga hermonthica]
TKKTNGFVKSVARKLGFVDRFSFVDPAGLSGGLLLLRDSNVNIINIMQKPFYIAVEFVIGSAPPQWGIFVYMSSCKQIRVHQWAEMERDKACWGSKWFALGDWNGICVHEDKSGGIKRSCRSLLAFNSFINNMEMEELPMLGYRFTWCNLREAEGLVEEKLDRAFASNEWRLDFPNATVSTKVRSASDHSMLLLCKGLDHPKHPSRFHFDKRWLSKEGISDIVSTAWNQPTYGTPFYRLKEKVKSTRTALLIWSSKFKSLNQQTIEVLTRRLETMREDKPEDYWELWNNTRNDLNAAHKQEELHWQQRSKLKWLKEGDGNTKFFHAYTLQKRKLNAISRLITPSGSVLSSQEDIEHHIADFYSNLFTTEGSRDGESIVNLQKSGIYFSRNTPQTLRDNICGTLQGIVPHRSSRYLGLPLGIGRSKKEVFDYILNSIRNKLQGWKNSLLSPAGKEVLIKSIIEAIPIFSMS